MVLKLGFGRGASIFGAAGRDRNGIAWKMYELDFYMFLVRTLF